MTYECNNCKFVSKRKYDYERHIKSNKHKIIMQTNKDNIKDTEDDMRKQVAELKQQLAEKDKVIENKDKLLENVITSKDKDLEFLRNIASKAGTITEKTLDIANKNADVAKQSMSALTFLRTYYNNAPALEAPKEWLPEFKRICNIEVTISDDDEFYDEEYFKSSE